ncbi:hypothetical protein IPN41_00635 [Candidatus Falkowbacteria bacterium]|nr:MAG: hypothetical protein IPN41_00635 [Candidatus Falkowbacteria bacterium]
MPTENSSIIVESLHLLIKNIEECRRIVSKEYRSPNDIADFLISLHLVLEISINACIRDIVINNLQKTIDKAKIVENLDKISFIEKATLFIYMEKYDFSGELHEADKHHRIIGTMKDFAKTRNFLMHGSMIGGFLDVTSTTTPAVETLTNEHMENQITKFREICEGMKFYIRHLKDCKSNKDDLEGKFFDVNFLIKPV